jgi:Aminotransferase class-III
LFFLLKPSGGHVPVPAVLARKSIFDKVFDRMERAVVHGSTFGANDLAMAAGIATLDVLTSERLIEKAAELGERLLQGPAAMIPRYEFLHDVRGQGLIIGIEFGAPRSVKLKAAWHALDAVKRIFVALPQIHGAGAERVFGTAWHSKTALQLFRASISEPELTHARLLCHDRRPDPQDLFAGARLTPRKPAVISDPGLSVPHDAREPGAPIGW